MLNPPINSKRLSSKYNNVSEANMCSHQLFDFSKGGIVEFFYYFNTAPKNFQNIKK